MEEKKLTDEEIVKAYKYCVLDDGNCDDCPYEACGCGIDGYDIIDIINRQKAEIERLTEELKNLDWYKMWHKKFKKEIDDLTLELETYRPTKLSGHGQCKCGVCGRVSWTDWFSRYKGQTLCDKCLKEIVATEEKQAVKDTAKEILDDFDKHCVYSKDYTDFMRKEYGVGVE